MTASIDSLQRLHDLTPEPGYHDREVSADDIATARARSERRLADDAELDIDQIRLLSAAGIARKVVRTSALSEQANHGYDLACLLLQILEDSADWQPEIAVELRKMARERDRRASAENAADAVLAKVEAR